jgi:hypothetical protein
MPNDKAFSSSVAAAHHEIHEENRDGNDQQQMDEASGDVQAEAKKPQDQENSHDGVEHVVLPPLTEQMEGRSQFLRFICNLCTGSRANCLDTGRLLSPLEVATNLRARKGDAHIH